MSESRLFAIAVKGDSSDYDLVQKTQALAKLTPFPPGKGDSGLWQKLRVGTLDTLMSLSDDLIKMDSMSEGTVWKIYRQLTELQPDDPPPTIEGVPMDLYAFNTFEWAEAKFKTTTPLRELSESISGRIGGIDEELKTKLGEYNLVKGALQQAERKLAGTLQVRGLTDIVTEADMRGTIGSDTMTTLMVVVSKHSYKDFLSTYEMAGGSMLVKDKEGKEGKMFGVVPRSAKLIVEDAETGLFAVVVFKKSTKAFADVAREKKWTIRDFTYDPTRLAEENAKRETDLGEEMRLKDLLIQWCKINFAEAYTNMMHLKAVRIFVESVLRYGLSPNVGPNFKAFLLQPKKGKEEALHKALKGLYGGGHAADFEGEDETAVPGATGEFYPYGFCTIDTEVPGPA
jgi:V-type H+-transporting ATPase subunit C